MIRDERITQAMLKQHSIINRILLDFEKISEQDSVRLTKTFGEFSWRLSKHIFIEEENIFPVSDKNNKLELKQLQTLLNEHNDIKKIVENLDEEIMFGRKPNTAILRELLFAHEEREISGFYPLLDSRLSEKQKKDIFSKLRDIKF